MIKFMCIQDNNYMTAITTNKPKQGVFNSFHNTVHSKKVYSSLYYKRNHRVEESDTKTKVKIAAGSVIATLLPMIYFAKKQGKPLHKIKYELKEVLALSTASILGGVVSGIAADKKSNKKRKINEGVFQFMNATIPTMLVGGALKLIEDNTKYKESKAVKAAAIVTGLVAGMPLAAFISNLINDPKDKEPDRKLTLKDSIINMDDALGALIVAKIPIVGKLHLEKIMPAVFAWCGYRAGESN